MMTPERKRELLLAEGGIARILSASEAAEVWDHVEALERVVASARGIVSRSLAVTSTSIGRAGRAELIAMIEQLDAGNRELRAVLDANP